MKWLILVVGLMPFRALVHDYHISILTIRYQQGAGTLDLTWQITAHDMEHALSDVVDLDLGSVSQHPQADSLMHAHLAGHLMLDVGSGPLELEWVGWELEGENLFCYMQVAGIDGSSGLIVSNDLFHGLLEDQDNIVHLEMMDGIRTHHFLRGEGHHKFDFE